MRKTRAFLDANILFSLSYKEGSRLEDLFKKPDVEYFASDYVIAAAERNLPEPQQKARLKEFVTRLSMTDAWQKISLPEDIYLPEKDRPVLQAAISCKANYLITGDFKDFGQYFGKKICDITIVPPREFLK
jgi:predicted nucleic acid-binding protein